MQLLRLSSWTCSSRRTSPPNRAKVISFKPPVAVAWARRMLIVTFATTVAAVSTAAIADDAGSFFAGKTVRIVVGFSAGGGYDIYARELGRYLGRHIPGHPSVVVQNMAGAGSLKAVNFLFNAAPRDGPRLRTFCRGIVFEPTIGLPDAPQLHAPKVNSTGTS